MLWLAMLQGCVVHVLGDGSGEAELYMEPSTLYAGETEVVTVTDNYGELNFDETYDVRSLGDFEVVEWNANGEQLGVVIRVDQEASGSQALAVDLSSDTYYVSFDAY